MQFETKRHKIQTQIDLGAFIGIIDANIFSKIHNNARFLCDNRSFCLQQYKPNYDNCPLHARRVSYTASDRGILRNMQ